MKLLTQKHKIYLIRHARKQLYRRLRRKYIKCKPRYRVTLPAPEILDVSKNETLYFLNELRKYADDRLCALYVDFKPIKYITPSCALVLASEFDRMSRIRGKRNRIQVVDFDKWDTNIKVLLRDMGMFDLLNIRNIPKDFSSETCDNKIRFFKFIVGNSIDGSSAIKFKDTINSVIAGVPNEKKLQIAITEAMDNVFNHGYPDDFIQKSKLKYRLWWLSASIDTQKNILHLMFFDQGIGIPQSLPRIHPGLFGKIVELFDTDDKIIKAATQAGRSATGKKYRGKGLPQIIGYVCSYDKPGYIRIQSGKGIYEKIKNNDKKTVDKLYTVQYDIHGTLLEWQLEL